MSTQTHTKREKGQALFLAALMVLSVFAMSAAFAGAAAAQEDFTVTVEDEDGEPIEDATVSIDDSDSTTDENGVAVFSVATDGGAELSVTADGYDGYDTTLTPDTLEEGDYVVAMNEGDATDSSFDSSSYSEEAGDIVDFTIDMEHADDAVVVLEDEDGNYWADLHVESGGEDEVNVSFNSYNAGQDGANAFSTDTEGASVSVHDEQTITADGAHLNPGAYTLDLYVNEEGESITVESVDDGDRADVEELERAYTAQLELSEGSIGDSTVGVAPADADLSEDVEYDDLEVVTTGDEVAEGDYVSVAVDASGIFGYLADSNYDDLITFEMEQTNPATYQSPDTLSAEEGDFEIVENPETNQVFFVLDTDDIDTEAGAEYDVTFSVSEDYGYADEDTESTTSFSVVDRSVEVTGDFDEDDRLQVELSEDSTITGESSIAPGSDVQVRLGLGAPDYPTLSQTAEVQDDGTIEADFDVSDREVDEELDVEIEDRNSDASDSVSAILVESADDYDQDPHTVTITVTDADGEPVEDAEVEIDGQTETTDSNGEATFELHHGEYDVSATHDGESASGTVTVDDESSDTGSLTLGEEDAGEINDPADDADDGVDDEDDGLDDDDTGVDDDDATDADDDDATDADDGTDTDDDDDPEDEEQPGFGIAVALIALLAAAGIALRNRA